MAQHELIASHYRNKIIAALMEFKPGLNQEIYNAFSWEDLDATSTYNVLNTDDFELELQETIDNYVENIPSCQE